MDDDRRPERLRRDPPPFRWAEVAGVEDLSPRLRRLTLAGPELAGLPAGLPAASLRLFLPQPGEEELPAWHGNDFRRADGTRPVIRTLTPRRVDTGPGAAVPEVDVDVVLHGAGALASWTRAAGGGERVAVSGTGRGYDIDPAAPAFVVAGDESALGAIGILLEALPPDATVEVLVEAAEPSARFALPHHPGATVSWPVLDAGAPPGTALLDGLHALDAPDDARWWVAGEAAAVQRIRRHLFEDRGVPRARATVRGYWKVGRTAGYGDP